MGAETAQATLIYLHIPKCAGTTMMSVLRANYGDGLYRVGNGGGWRQFHKRPAAQRECITCLTGHMPWGLCQYVRAPYQHAVMLRNPIDRVVSLYWFVRDSKGHKWHSLARRLSLAEFAVCGAFADLDNGMTRWLSGNRRCGSLRSKQPIGDQDLMLAMSHLRACAVVAFVEAFGFSLSRMAETFGWEHTDWQRRMVGKAHRPATVEERQIIAEYDRVDMALYEYGLGL